MESLAGTTIGGYKLVRSIATGPIGETLAAEDKSGEPVAVQVLHPALSLYSKVESYWDEVQKVRDLKHPQIAVPEVGDWSKAGRFYMAMPLQEGLTLRQALEQHGKLPAKQVLLMMGQICQALEAVHGAGMVHGAVTPDNIFLAFTDEPHKFSARLMGFATGCLMEPGKAPDPKLEDGIGVPDPRYMAPEQFEGPGSADADIYALGAVLYESLCGQPPYSGTREELATKHAAGELKMGPEIPDKMDRIIKKCMHRTAKKRFSKVSELREILEMWVSTKPAALKLAPIDLGTKKAPEAGVVPDQQEQQAPAADEAPEEAPAEAGDTLEQEPVDMQTSEEKTPDTAEEPAPESAEEAAADSAEEAAAEAPEDPELAAIAEQAASKLRQDKADTAEEQPLAAAPEEKFPTRPRRESYRDLDGDLVELPVERSVKAFVASISPSLAVAAPMPVAKANGESLDAALDAFVKEAKAWSATLPPPPKDEKELEELASPPRPKPKPEPKPAAPEPKKAAPAPAVMQPVEAEKKSPVLPVVVGLVLGALVGFGVSKIMGGDEQPAPAPTEPAAATADEIQPAGEPDPAATATDEPQVSPLDEPTPGAAAKQEEGQPAAEPGATEAAGTDPAAAAAAGADAGAEPTAAGTEPAAAGTEPAAAGTEPAAGKPAPAVVAKKVTPKKKKPRRKAKKAGAKKKKPAKKKAAKKKKSGGDWVDPFSQ